MLIKFRHPRHWPLGSLWMLVASLGFAVMGACVKQGAARFSTAELVFYRSAFGFVSIALVVAWHGKSLVSPVMRTQMGRALTGFTALLLFFYAIAHLPLATAITLNYTSPMFLALIAPWLLPNDHPLTPRQRLLLRGCVASGFVGVTLLLSPVWDGQLWFAGCMGLLSGFGAAMAYAHVKQLGMLHEPDWRTVFYFTLVCTLASGAWMLGSDFTPLTWQDLPMLAGLGVSATIGQLAMTRAYRTGRTLTVASLAYSTVVFATLIGVVLWNERLSPVEYLGILLVVLTGVVSTRVTADSPTPPDTEPETTE